MTCIAEPRDAWEGLQDLRDLPIEHSGLIDGLQELCAAFRKRLRPLMRRIKDGASEGNVRGSKTPLIG